MKILTAGHKFELASFEGGPAQTIQFIEKVSELGTDTLRTINDGTTNEEVLEMLISRLKYLQQKFACRENEKVLDNLEVALMYLNKRTEDRKTRNVEGKKIQ